MNFTRNFLKRSFFSRDFAGARSVKNYEENNSQRTSFVTISCQSRLECIFFLLWGRRPETPVSSRRAWSQIESSLEEGLHWAACKSRNLSLQSDLKLSAPKSRDSLRLRRRFYRSPKNRDFFRPQDARFPLRRKSLANRDFFCEENGLKWSSLRNSLRYPPLRCMVSIQNEIRMRHEFA